MTSTTALRFKITLLGIRPPVWRRIEIPDDATFWTLPCAIQDAMGWTDTHLHEFRRGRSRAGVGYPLGSESIGIPDPEWPEDRVRAGWKTAVSDYFAEPGGLRVLPRLRPGALRPPRGRVLRPGEAAAGVVGDLTGRA